MKMKLMAIIMIAASFISGCTLVEQFEQAKSEYLETRVVELLDELPEEEAVIEEEVVEKTLVETEEVILEETEVVEDAAEAEEGSDTETEDTEETPEADDAADTEEEQTVEPTQEATEEPQATPEPEPTVEPADPAEYLGDASWMDEMDTAEFWPTGTDQFSSAAFENGKLKITALSDVRGWRLASAPVLENAYIQADVEMGTCAGTDGYGLMFRVPENTGYNQGYLFEITCDGRYAIRKWNGLSGENGTMTTLKYYTISESINKGSDQSNRIGIMALNDRLVMYVNGEKVGEVSDADFTSGFFGLYVKRDKTQDLTIFVDSVSYWTDPIEQ
jgi:hypothetical protein